MNLFGLGPNSLRLLSVGSGRVAVLGEQADTYGAFLFGFLLSLIIFLHLCQEAVTHLLSWQESCFCHLQWYQCIIVCWVTLWTLPALPWSHSFLNSTHSLKVYTVISFINVQVCGQRNYSMFAKRPEEHETAVSPLPYVFLILAISGRWQFWSNGRLTKLIRSSTVWKHVFSSAVTLQKTPASHITVPKFMFQLCSSFLLPVKSYPRRQQAMAWVGGAPHTHLRDGPTPRLRALGWSSPGFAGICKVNQKKELLKKILLLTKLLNGTRLWYELSHCLQGQHPTQAPPRALTVPLQIQLLLIHLEKQLGSSPPTRENWKKLLASGFSLAQLWML